MQCPSTIKIIGERIHGDHANVYFNGVFDGVNKGAPVGFVATMQRKNGSWRFEREVQTTPLTAKDIEAIEGNLDALNEHSPDIPGKEKQSGASQ
jgi:hypothetical protein